MYKCIYRHAYIETHMHVHIATYRHAYVATYIHACIAMNRQARDVGSPERRRLADPRPPSSSHVPSGKQAPRTDSVAHVSATHTRFLRLCISCVLMHTLSAHTRHGHAATANGLLQRTISSHTCSLCIIVCMFVRPCLRTACTCMAYTGLRPERWTVRQ